MSREILIRIQAEWTRAQRLNSYVVVARDAAVVRASLRRVFPGKTRFANLRCGIRLHSNKILSAMATTIRGRPARKYDSKRLSSLD